MRICRHCNKPIDIDRKLLISLKNSGLSLKELADHFNVSKPAISQALKAEARRQRGEKAYETK